MSKKTSKFPPKKPDNSHIIKPRVIHEWSDYQKNIFKNISQGTGNTIVIARAGSAKCLGIDTPILLLNGSTKKVQDIVVGDLLMGPDSKPRKVLSISSGNGDLVRISPVKGESWICNTDHILTLVKSNHGKGIIQDISVKDFIEQNKHLNKIDKNWKLIRTGVSFDRVKKLPYEPYLIGLWIGDGTKSKPDITSADDKIIKYCQNIASKYNLECVVRKEKSKAYNVRFRTASLHNIDSKNNPHLLKRFLLSKCIIDNEKNIPQEYLISSRKNRLELLAGIIDTDGGMNGNGHITISSTIKKLAEQYAFLARSLGFAAYISQKIAKIKSINYETKYWAVNVSGDLSTIPCLLLRKQSGTRKQIKNHLCTGFSINNIGIGNYYGFTLDGDGRFLLGDFTITHNTSSLVEGSRYIPKGKKALFCAFNKSIQLDLRNRLSHYIECSTLHSLGLRAIKLRFGEVKINDNKCFEIVSKIVDNEKQYDLIINICKTVGLCKSRLVDIPSKIDEIIAEFDIDLCDIDVEVFIQYVCQTLRLCKEQTNVVDFNDMIWLCFVYRLNPGKFDIVFIDECQDLTRGQLELALSAVKIDGRVIAVLDDRQVLYSFAGVEIDVLDILRKRLNATELTLPICYRCPKSVVILAQQYVPDILPFDRAIEGNIEHITYNDLYNKVIPGCFVLSRTNAPLISICMKMIRSGIKANILGRDIGDGLQYLIKRSKKKTVISLLEWLPKWEKEEKARVLAKNPKAKTEFITDKLECLVNLCENCSTLEEVKDNINKMFKDTEDGKVVWLSTIHKRKGAETDVVFVLNDTLRYSSISEENCVYVGTTRCKKELYFVNKTIV